MLFALWFLIVFLFYTSYYAGGVNYNAGIDVRYFASAFHVVAILAAYGFLSVLNFIHNIEARAKNTKKAKASKSHIN